MGTIISMSVWLLHVIAASKGVPMPDKNPLTVVLSVNKAQNPLTEKYASLVITNNTSKAIEIVSHFPSGAAIPMCLDVEVLSPEGKRLSKEFYLRSISSPEYSEPRLADTIQSGKSIKMPFVSLFEGIDRSELPAGKYKCRVNFVYDDLKASSEQIVVEITTQDIEKQ